MPVIAFFLFSVSTEACAVLLSCCQNLEITVYHIKQSEISRLLG
jgi:hypothetical protein